MWEPATDVPLVEVIVTTAMVPDNTLSQQTRSVKAPKSGAQKYTQLQQTTANFLTVAFSALTPVIWHKKSLWYAKICSKPFKG